MGDFPDGGAASTEQNHIVTGRICAGQVLGLDVIGASQSTRRSQCARNSGLRSAQRLSRV